MAFKLADRVKESTITTGTGNIALGGAITNFETFSANLSNSDTTYYAIVDNTNGAFEVGLGTYNSSGNTLSRSVIASSNSNSAVNLGVGTKEVFITAIADKIVMEDGSNNVSIGGTVTATAFSGSGASLTALNVSTDSTPQLGGNLDMNGNDIVTTSNADLELAPDGTGRVVVKGGTNPGAIVLNCQQNTHGQTLKSQDHDQAASNTLLLPDSGDTGSQDLVAVNISQTLTNKTLTSPVIETVTGSTITLDSAGDINLDAGGADVTLKDDGTTFGSLTNSSGELVIKSGSTPTTAMTFSGANVTLAGNLTVSGTTTTVNSTTVTLDDHNLVLDSNNSGSAVVNGAGITIEGGSGDDATFSYNTTGPKFELKLGSNHESLQVDQLIADSLDIENDVDINGNMEADTMTLNGASITSTATLSTGISNGNVLVATSGVVDNDFLRVDGTSVEGRSASEVADDIGAATKGFATAMAIAL
jgi:hypothetical protein